MSKLISISDDHHKALSQLKTEHGTNIGYEAQKAMEQSSKFMIVYNKKDKK